MDNRNGFEILNDLRQYSLDNPNHVMPAQDQAFLILLILGIVLILCILAIPIIAGNIKWR